jgi:hypothetical protein
MDKLAVVLAVLAVGASALVQIFTDPRITRRFVAKSLIALAVYAGHVAIGLLVVMLLLPHGPEAALGITLALLGWISLGALGLIRFVPRLREPPAILMHFGIADFLCLLAIILGVLSAFGILHWPISI